MAGSILGTSVRRFEDPELLRGQATFIDNLRLPGLAVATFVRSPLAHGLIRSIDTSEAAAMAGVFGVFTAADLGLAPQAIFIRVAEVFDRPPLATDRVRFVGEPVVIVVAATKAQAYDAAETVIVDYEPLPVVVDPEEAFGPEAVVLFPEHGSNLSFSVADPIPADFFADADVVVRGRFVNQRIAVAPMEPNAFAAVPQPDGRLLAYASTQMPHVMHPMLAAALAMPLSQVQIIAPHVGGGFGGKAGSYTEYSAVAAAALRLDRPVSWVETRSEDFVGLVHSRAQVQYVELGCRLDGTFTGLRARIVGDSGAYPGVGTMLPAGTRRMSQGVYGLPKLAVEVACATTNTTQTGAYRGAGRPEAASMVERIVDMAALELAIDPAEIRRRNFLTPDQFPYETLTGVTYDSGDYDVPLTEVLRLSGYDDLRAEQAARRSSGDTKLLGIGLSTYVEITAGGANGSEFGAVEIHTDGSATVRCGTSAHGQGHATSFAMIVADRLGIVMDQVRLVQSDTDLVRTGGGTGGSRSLQLGGSAVLKAADAVMAKAKRLAAHLLEAAENDMVLGADGRVGVAGVPTRALSWAELALAAADPTNGPFLGRAEEDRRGPALAPLSAQLDFVQVGPTFPFGAHIAVVEVDAETGRVELLRHIAVDDCGTVVNPLLVAGQQHGGVASGIAQALYEHMVYDENGNPLTTNFADYAIPSAAEFPSFEVSSTETPSPNNPLGAKGIGEAGTIGATPAVQNAVVDALAHLGVRHLDMPLTPETVWRALEGVRLGTLPDPWREPPAVFATLSPTLVDVNKLADEADV